MLAAARASALEAGELGDEPVTVDVTEASSLLYNVDNRDTAPHQVNTVANDAWGLWYNRANLQASWGKWQLGLRVDSAYFFVSPDPVTLAVELERERPRTAGSLSSERYFWQKFDEAGIELSNRYINWVYPAKYYVGYTSRDVELMLGDFYAQLGRGFVLSVRKLDEVSSDVTVRGARATGRLRLGDWRLKVTALGGGMNPLRLDEASGRYLGVDSEVTPGFLAVTEAGMPRSVSTDFVPEASATYAPDRIVAGQVELSGAGLRLGSQASLLVRQTPLSRDLVRSASRITTASQSLEAPSLGEHGSLYLEAALQQLEFGTGGVEGEAPGVGGEAPGYAFYGATTWVVEPFALLLEGKHYRRLFSLLANVNLARAREFSLVQYSSPPTTEAFWVDTEFEGFNTCVTGGRAKLDARVGANESVFGWVGRYDTWAESVSNDACDTDEQNLNRVWDVATGFELASQNKRSRANLTVGARFDDTAVPALLPSGALSDVFYREESLRYDITKHLSGPFSLQFQGWHRRRHQVRGGPGEPWFEGQQLLGFDWAPKFSAGLGLEYDTNPQTPPTYVNAQVKWRFSSDSNLALFVGQRRGTLRCLGGVCRVFPPFEGARLDLTARF